MKAFLYLLFVLFALPTHAVDLTTFGQLPIAAEGRIIPLQEFARRWQGRIAPDGNETGSLEALTRLLLDPARTQEMPLVQIDNPQIRQALALPPHASERYSLAELRAAFTPRKTQISELLQRYQREETLSFKQEYELALYLKFQQLRQLNESLLLLSPLAGQEGLSYLDLYPRLPIIRAEAETLARQKGTNLARYSAAEVAQLNLSMQLDALAGQAMGNGALPILPLTNGDWLSPWQAIGQSQLTPMHVQILRHWQAMQSAYLAEDDTSFEQAAKAALHDSLTLADTPLLKARLWLEPYYHALHPFMLLAGLCLMLAIMLAITPLGGAITTRLYFGLIALHGGLLLLRMFLMARAPVSNLHESALFVSFLLGLSGLLFRRHPHFGRILGLLLLCSGGLLYVGESLIAAPQDRLPVLAAVLNSNFWLGTHVIAITTGYSLSLLAGVLAHYYLWHGRAEHRILTPLLVAALFFTAIGTWLGGIWADQSWGRFWGWDPKENGALMIVLWLAWLLHYRLHRWYHPRYYLVISACLPMVVALAWFGVNLLSVGLHSYGFTTAAASGLFAFLALDAAILSALALRDAKTKTTPS